MERQRGLSSVDMQLCRSLEQLQDAVDMVFDTITHRVAEEHERLKGLSKRIQAAKAKVDAISGTKQAITVFSSTKFPRVPSEVMDFTPLFGAKPGQQLPIIKVELSAGNWQEDANEGTLELFRFFLETSQEHSYITLKHKDGIGTVPADVKSVADVLLFNSTELPYHEYKFLDNLEGREQPSAERETYGKPAMLPPPPQSLLQNSNLSTPGLEEYGFKPTLRQVPLFSLPSRLPDLPMVADISWTGSSTGIHELSSIAPSAAYKSLQKASVSGNKSEIDTDIYRTGPVVENSPMPSPSASTKTSSVDEDSVACTQGARSIKGKEKTHTPPPPPPPPPPLPSAPFPPVTNNSPTTPNVAKKPYPSPSGASSSTKTSVPPFDAERAALLQSIRSPSITLRKTGLVESSEKTLEHQSQEADHHKQPVDLLAEMATTLKMRRLSMKGATHDVAKIPTSPNVSLKVSHSSGESRSTKSPLPITNFQAFIPESTDDMSDEDDDWEE